MGPKFKDTSSAVVMANDSFETIKNLQQKMDKQDIEDMDLLEFVAKLEKNNSLTDIDNESQGLYNFNKINPLLKVKICRSIQISVNTRMQNVNNTELFASLYI